MKERFNYLISHQYVFLTCWVVLIITLATALLSIDKASLHVLLNDGFDMGYHTGVHTPTLDLFFRYFTMVAEYAPYIIVVALLFYRYDWATIAAIGQLGATLTTQILKHIINAPRPKTFFLEHNPELIPQLHWVDGVNMHSWFSFPSGHTTAFFALFFLLSLMTDKKWLQFIYFLFAMLGGYSRIYLSQHFSSDVLAGCIIGVLLTATAYLIPWNKYHWTTKNLRTTIANRSLETKG